MTGAVEKRTYALAHTAIRIRTGVRETGATRLNCETFICRAPKQVQCVSNTTLNP